MPLSIATHDRPFRAAQLVALAILRGTPEFAEAQIIRTKDPQGISNADVLVGVGDEYDPACRRFHLPSNLKTMADLTGGEVKGINETPFNRNGRQFNQSGHLTDLVSRFKVDYEPDSHIHNFPVALKLVASEVEAALTFCYRGSWPYQQIVVQSASLYSVPFSIPDLSIVDGCSSVTGKYIGVRASKPLNAATAFCCFLLSRLEEFAGTPIILSNDPNILEGAVAFVEATSVKKIYDSYFDAFLRNAWVTDNALKGCPMGDHEVACTMDKLYTAFVHQLERNADRERPSLSGIISHNIWERVQRPTLDENGMPFTAAAAFKRAVDLMAAETVEALIYYHEIRYPMHQVVNAAFANRMQITGHNQILLLNKGGPWKDLLEDIEKAESDLAAPILFVILLVNAQWVVKAVSRDLQGRKNIPRKPLPWATSDEARKETGINVLYVRTIEMKYLDDVSAAVGTREEALALARLACDAPVRRRFGEDAPVRRRFGEVAPVLRRFGEERFRH